MKKINKSKRVINIFDILINNKFLVALFHIKKMSALIIKQLTFFTTQLNLIFLITPKILPGRRHVLLSEGNFFYKA